MDWSTEIAMYLGRGLVGIAFFILVALLLRKARKQSIWVVLGFSLVATWALTPVPALIELGHMPNALFSYVFEPLTLTAFWLWPYTRVAALITFVVVFVASRLLIGRPNNSFKPKPLRGSA